MSLLLGVRWSCLSPCLWFPLRSLRPLRSNVFTLVMPDLISLPCEILFCFVFNRACPVLDTGASRGLAGFVCNHYLTGFPGPAPDPIRGSPEWWAQAPTLRTSHSAIVFAPPLPLLLRFLSPGPLKIRTRQDQITRDSPNRRNHLEIHLRVAFVQGK